MKTSFKTIGLTSAEIEKLPSYYYVTYSGGRTSVLYFDKGKIISRNEKTGKTRILSGTNNNFYYVNSADVFAGLRPMYEELRKRGLTGIYVLLRDRKCNVRNFTYVNFPELS